MQSERTERDGQIVRFCPFLGDSYKVAVPFGFKCESMASNNEVFDRADRERICPGAEYNWTACGDDGCLHHLSEKEGSGYYPRVRKDNRQRRARYRVDSDTTPGRNDQGDELGEQGELCERLKTNF